MHVMSDGHVVVGTKGDTVCPLCGKAIDSATGLCSRCGSVASRIGRCIHCNTVTSTQPHKDLIWSCSVCGEARILGGSYEQIASVSEDLKSATRDNRLATLTRVGAIVGAGMGVVGLLFVLFVNWMLSPNNFALGLMTFFPVVCLLLAGLATLKTQNLRNSCREFLGSAYGLAIVKLLSERTTGATSHQLGEILGLEPLRAEQLLSHLNVRDDITSDVTDDGTIEYSARASTTAIGQMHAEIPVAGRLRILEEEPASHADASESSNPTSAQADIHAAGPSKK